MDAGPSQFQNLPYEIILQILSYIDFLDALAVSSVNVLLRSCLSRSQQLQYRFMAQVAGIENNSFCTLDFNERLKALKKSEDSWANLRIDFQTELPIQHSPFGIYDLTGGIYLMGDENQKAVHYCRLPSKESDPVEWTKISIDDGSSIVDVGLAIYEHDLIAVVTTTPLPTRINAKVEIRLLEFSTGKPHPQARHTNLFVRVVYGLSASIGIEIVGDHLALVTTPNSVETVARFCVFNWKTGVLILDYPVLPNTYSSVIFLSPTHILLPNASTATLDLFIIPLDHKDTPPTASEGHKINEAYISPSSPELRLALPTIATGHSIRAIYGRAEPNPAPSGIRHAYKPFIPAPEDAIAIFNMHIRRDDGEPPWGDFSMFVHRSSLLRLCEEYRDHEGCEGAGEGEGEGGGEGEGEGEVKTVPWEEWGPDVTRWIDTGVVPWWITTSTGQRCVLSVSPLNVPGAEPSVIVLDFNPTSVKKLKSLKKTMDPYRYLQVHERQPFVFEEVSRISHPVFEKEVKSSLPNVTVAKLFNDQPFEFDGILMDEERLLGLVTDEDGRVTNIEIFHIGSKE